MAILDVAKYLVGEDIHCEIYGTSRRTFPALEAFLRILSAVSNDFGKQSTVLTFHLAAIVHLLAPVLGWEVRTGMLRRQSGGDGINAPYQF